MTKVVNINHGELFDVYIGRAGHGYDGYFGNPCGRDLDAYARYFNRRVTTDAEFCRRVWELKDKTLGCFCNPKPCHGDYIKWWLDEIEDGSIDNLLDILTT